MAESQAPQVLDLTAVEDRPIVKLQQGDYELRNPEELTFNQFARQQRIGGEIIEAANNFDGEGMLETLERLVIEASQIMFVDLPDEVARELTPGMYLKIATFFKGLTDAVGAPVSKTSENSAPTALASTEHSEEV